MTKPFICGACHKRFATEKGAWVHIGHKHRRPGVFVTKANDWRSSCDDEPSLAERAVEAQIAIAAGLPTDDGWLVGEPSDG